MKDEEQYYQQFVGEDVRGTRFMARYSFDGGSYGVVYDCLTYNDCVQKAKKYSNAHPQKNAHIVIIELPDEYSEIIRECIK